MSLKDRAIEAYDKTEEVAREHAAAVERERAEEGRQRFIECFGVEPDIVDYPLYLIEDIVLKIDGRVFELRGDCPNCSKPLWHSGIYDVTTLGHALVDFNGDHVDYVCAIETADRERPETWQDLLVKAVEWGIRENLYPSEY